MLLLGWGINLFFNCFVGFDEDSEWASICTTRPGESYKSEFWGKIPMKLQWYSYENLGANHFQWSKIIETNENLKNLLP